MNATDFFKWTRRVSKEIPGASVQIDFDGACTHISIRVRTRVENFGVSEAVSGIALEHGDAMRVLEFLLDRAKEAAASRTSN